MKHFFIILSFLFFASCGPNISCDSSDTLDILEDSIEYYVLNDDYERGFRFGEAIGLSLFTDERYTAYIDGTREIPNPKYKIKNIRVKNYNKRTNSYSCAAELEYKWNDGLVKNLKMLKNITYQVEETTEGDIYVSNLFGF